FWAVSSLWRDGFPRFISDVSPVQIRPPLLDREPPRSPFLSENSVRGKTRRDRGFGPRDQRTVVLNSRFGRGDCATRDGSRPARGSAAAGPARAAAAHRAAGDVASSLTKSVQAAARW